MLALVPAPTCRTHGEASGAANMPSKPTVPAATSRPHWEASAATNMPSQTTVPAATSRTHWEASAAANLPSQPTVASVARWAQTSVASPAADVLRESSEGRRPRFHATPEIPCRETAAEQFRAGDLEAFYETLTLVAFRDAPVSLTLAHPGLPDCPLVGVSRGFEKMTGYSWAESVGRNCRFLNRGCSIPGKVRHELRTSLGADKKFCMLLLNRRKNGEKFWNLLQIHSLRVGNVTYKLGIQADVTHTDVDLAAVEHLAELDRVADTIFSEHVRAANFQVAWQTGALLADLQMQRSSFDTDQLDSADPEHAPEQNEQQDKHEYGVYLLPEESASASRICCNNTFIEVRMEHTATEMQRTLRPVMSEPFLGERTDKATESNRLPATVLRDSWSHFHQDTWKQRLAAVEPLGAISSSARLSRGSEPLIDSVGGEDSQDASTSHPDGCTPCAFHCYSFMGCTKGDCCGYCHESHPRKTRRRGKKKDTSPPGVFVLEDEGQVVEYIGVETKGREQMPQKVIRLPSSLELMPLLNTMEYLTPQRIAFAVGQWA